MLTALRRLAGTWIAKLLFLVLVASFAVWGIGDVVRNFGQDDAVARVGGQPITLAQAQDATRRQIQNLQQQMGDRFQSTPEIQQAIAQQALQSLIADQLMSQEAKRLGLKVPDSAIRGFVFDIPPFKGANGQFSRALFQTFLSTNNMNEQQFLDLVRSDLTRAQIAGAVGAGIGAPQRLTTMLLAWQQERRTAAIALLRTADAPPPVKPTDEELQRFHANYPALYQAPEYREATVAVLTAALVTPTVQVSEKEIEDYYAAHHDQYAQPERRDIQQALLQDEAQAKAVADAWNKGADFAAITKQADASGGTAIDLGLVSASSLPLEDLSKPAFALAAGGTTAPIHTPFGWHVLHVVKIVPPETQPLAEVHDAVRQTVQSDKAADKAYDLSDKIEDALSGGATLDEVAKQYGLGIAHVVVDAQGNGRDGKPVALPVVEAARAPLLEQIFQAQTGAQPEMKGTNGAGFVAVDLTKVDPPALRPFLEVRDQVLANWTTDAMRREQEVKATALMEAVKAGKPLAEAAKAAGLTSSVMGPFQRDPVQGSPVPPEIIAPLFEEKIGGVTMVPTRSGFAVGQLASIVPHDAAADPIGLQRVGDATQQALVQEIEGAYSIALRNRGDVKLNPAMIRQIAQP